MAGQSGMMRAMCGMVLLLMLAAPARAVEADEILKDPALEARARAVSAELRCLVCQNESIDDSGAGLARDLRVLLREMLTAGASDAEVLAFLTERYGDFVLLRPRFTPATWALWLGPFALLGLTSVLLLRRRTVTPPAELTPHEQARLERVIGDDRLPPPAI